MNFVLVQSDCFELASRVDEESGWFQIFVKCFKYSRKKKLVFFLKILYLIIGRRLIGTIHIVAFELIIGEGNKNGFKLFIMSMIKIISYKSKNKKVNST